MKNELHLIPKSLTDLSEYLEEHEKEWRRLVTKEGAEKAYRYFHPRRIEVERHVRSNSADVIAKRLLCHLLHYEANCLDSMGRSEESLRLVIRANEIAQKGDDMMERYFGFSILSTNYRIRNDTDNARISLLSTINAVLGEVEKELLRLTLQELESLETREGNVEACKTYRTIRQALTRKRQPMRKLTAAEKLESLERGLLDSEAALHTGGG